MDLKIYEAKSGSPWCPYPRDVMEDDTILMKVFLDAQSSKVFFSAE